jgi:predicted DNA-binding protein (MmcQ/YjbR family)
MRARTAKELRAQFDDIKPGWHMSKTTWNTVINKEVPDVLTKELIDHSMIWLQKFNQENARRHSKRKQFVDSLLFD